MSMENDRLQGILFDAQDTIRFADASTVSKRMILKTRRVASKVSQQGSTISTPSINQYRAELDQMINGAIKLTSNINDNTQRLVSISEQTSKHLVAIEDHFGSALRTKPASTTSQPQSPLQV